MRKISTILFYLSALIGMILSIIGMSIAKEYYKDVLYNVNLISIVIGLVLRPILMHYDKPKHFYYSYIQMNMILKSISLMVNQKESFQV